MRGVIIICEIFFFRNLSSLPQELLSFHKLVFGSDKWWELLPLKRYFFSLLDWVLKVSESIIFSVHSKVGSLTQRVNSLCLRNGISNSFVITQWQRIFRIFWWSAVHQSFIQPSVSNNSSSLCTSKLDTDRIATQFAQRFVYTNCKRLLQLHFRVPFKLVLVVVSSMRLAISQLVAQSAHSSWNVAFSLFITDWIESVTQPPTKVGEYYTLSTSSS